MPAIISSVGHRAGCRLMKVPIGRRRRRLGGATRENVREYIDGHATAPPSLCGSPRSGPAGGGRPRRVVAVSRDRAGTRPDVAQRHEDPRPERARYGKQGALEGTGTFGRTPGPRLYI